MRRLEDNFEFVIVVGIIGVILFVFVLSCFSIFLHHLSIRFNLLVVWIHLFLFEFVSIFFFSCYAWSLDLLLSTLVTSDPAVITIDRLRYNILRNGLLRQLNT